MVNNPNKMDNTECWVRVAVGMFVRMEEIDSVLYSQYSHSISMFDK